jgi:hypothetical protein
VDHADQWFFAKSNPNPIPLGLHAAALSLIKPEIRLFKGITATIGHITPCTQNLLWLLTAV